MPSITSFWAGSAGRSGKGAGQEGEGVSDCAGSPPTPDLSQGDGKGALRRSCAIPRQLTSRLGRAHSRTSLRVIPWGRASCARGRSLASRKARATWQGGWTDVKFIHAHLMALPSVSFRIKSQTTGQNKKCHLTIELDSFQTITMVLGGSQQPL